MAPARRVHDDIDLQNTLPAAECPITTKKTDIYIRFHNRFICVGVSISIYALLTGGRI